MNEKLCLQNVVSESCQFGDALYYYDLVVFTM